MKARYLASRLERLETLLAPPPGLPEIIVEYVDTMTNQVAYTLHVKNGHSEYRTAGGKPTTFAEIARRSGIQ